jgi:protein TonB
MNEWKDSESHLPPPDHIQRRLLVGLVVSVLLNAGLWPFAAQFVRHHKIITPQTIEVTFVPRIPPRVINPKPKPHKVIVPPKPIPKPIPKPVVPVHVTHAVPPAAHNAPPTQQSHNKVITSTSKNVSSDHTALPGGNARLGVSTDHQNPGSSQQNTPTPPPPAPAPAAVPPPLAPIQKPEPVPTPPPPAGPTKDAEVVSQVLPDIPDDLKQEDFQSSVRVKVDIAPDGSFVPTLRSSSGNDQIDRIVLEALKKWKWKPALRNGEPVESIQLFRFDFEVN